MENLAILLIDDEQTQLLSLKSYLSKRKFKVYTAENGKKGFEIIQNNLVDIVFTDFRMPEWSGFDVVEKFKAFNPEIELVVMTAFGTIEDAVLIMKAGAYDYINKPIDLDELDALIERINEKKILVRENKELKEQLCTKFNFDTVVSQSGNMQDVLSVASRVAESKATVLISGESGTGKELIAKAIHYSSKRKTKPFVTVNVASLSENLLESELFGHEKGAFTGAINSRIGRFEQADGGTIFIDEVSEIPLHLQVKLLRAVQFSEVQKVGSNSVTTVDVRILAATNKNLEELISKDLFREDLFYRLNVVSINLPPLRKRKEDIPLLVDFFINKYSEENKKQLKGITKEALDELMRYNFPGNIRELENIIERALVLTRNEYITKKDLPSQINAVSEKPLLNPYDINEGYEEKVKAFERELITEALARSNGNQSAAARMLKITERHLRSRLERLGLK